MDFKEFVDFAWERKRSVRVGDPHPVASLALHFHFLVRTFRTCILMNLSRNYSSDFVREGALLEPSVRRLCARCVVYLWVMSLHISPQLVQNPFPFPGQQTAEDVRETGHPRERRGVLRTVQRLHGLSEKLSPRQHHRGLCSCVMKKSFHESEKKTCQNVRFDFKNKLKKHSKVIGDSVKIVYICQLLEPQFLHPPAIQTL